MNDVDYKIFYLERDDEITAVVDRIINAGVKNIAFVIPNGAQLIQSFVNLKLLKREAENAKKNIFLVTEDKTGKRLAERAGFKVFASRHELDNLFGFSSDINQDERKDLKSKEESFMELKSSLKKPLKITDIISESKIKEDRIRASKDYKEPDFSELKFPNDRKEKIFTEFERLEKYPTPKSQIANKPLKINRFESTQTSFVPSFVKKLLYTFLVLAIISGTLSAYFILPKAEIHIKQRREDFKGEIKMIADVNATKIDLALLKIPAAYLSEPYNKASKNFSTTGERQINEKARGVVTIYNAYSSVPQSLIESTRFADPDGRIFRLNHSVVIPGAEIREGEIVASSIDVEVTADQPGEEYNIGSSDFSIPGFQGTSKYGKFYGKSKAPMTGGANGKIKILSQEDFDKAKEILIGEIKDITLESFKDKISSEFKIFDTALKEGELQIISSVRIGEPADSFELTVQKTAEAIVFDQKYAKQLVNEYVSSHINSDKEIEENELILNYLNPKINFEKQQLIVDIQFIKNLSHKVDVDELKKSIVGKDQKAVETVFSNHPEIDSGTYVNFWPFWVRKVPNQLEKIHVTID